MKIALHLIEALREQLMRLPEPERDMLCTYMVNLRHDLRYDMRDGRGARNQGRIDLAALYWGFESNGQGEFDEYLLEWCVRENNAESARNICSYLHGNVRVTPAVKGILEKAVWDDSLDACVRERFFRLWVHHCKNEATWFYMGRVGDFLQMHGAHEELALAVIDSLHWVWKSLEECERSENVRAEVWDYLTTHPAVQERIASPSTRSLLLTRG